MKTVGVGLTTLKVPSLWSLRSGLLALLTRTRSPLTGWSDIRTERRPSEAGTLGATEYQFKSSDV